jgi:hypothetical protein
VEKTLWGQWSTIVGRGRNLLCPPTAGGGCTFCPSECEIHGHRYGGSSDYGDAYTSIDAAADFGVGFLGEHCG